MPDRRPSQIAIAAGLTKYALIATLRNKNSLFFGLMFPLGFVLVFGALGGGPAKADIGLSDKLAASGSPLVAALKAIGAKKDSPIRLTTKSDALLEQAVKQGSLGAAVEAGANGEVVVLTSTANPIGGGAAAGILRGIANEINLQAATGAAGPEFKKPIEMTSRDVAGKELRYFDFVLPGMIAFSLISTATFGVAFPFLGLRRALVLKRMLATPASPLSFVVSQCLSRSVQAVAQTAIIIGVGVGVYHFELLHGAATYIEMLVTSFVAICAFMGFGILLANIAKDEQTAPLIINMFNLPQFLISGVFFPTNTLPRWIQIIADNLPLSYCTQALRGISTDGKHLTNVLPQIGGMLAWSVLAYVAAAKTYRTE